jgi:hypothetical protein
MGLLFSSPPQSSEIEATLEYSLFETRVVLYLSPDGEVSRYPDEKATPLPIGCIFHITKAVFFSNPLIKGSLPCVKATIFTNAGRLKRLVQDVECDSFFDDQEPRLFYDKKILKPLD